VPLTPPDPVAAPPALPVPIEPPVEPARPTSLTTPVQAPLDAAARMAPQIVVASRA
jgi:hypothetical protein